MAVDNVSGTQTAPQTAVIVNKDLVKAFKKDHDLHVLLLMRKHNFSKAEAVVAAYATGVTAVAALLK